MGRAGGNYCIPEPVDGRNITVSQDNSANEPMKTTLWKAQRDKRCASAGVLLAALLMAAAGATAATPTYWWDTNGTDDGPGNPPDGVWDWSTPNWTTDYNGDSPPFAYPGRANVVFAATGGAEWDETYDYTVDIQGEEQVSDIVIEDGNCTLTNDFGYLDKDTPYISVLNYGQTATIYSVISSASGTANGITMFAWGTLVLGGTNTYQGPTTIEGGTLQLAAPQVLPRSSTLVLAGGDTRPQDGYSSTSAKFATGGYSQTLGPLVLTGPYTNLIHTIDFGHGASKLVFADSHTQNWGGIALHLLNYKPGVDSLRFGTSSSGLTATQLGLLRFNGFLDVPGRIDADGFVTPLPPPTLSIAPSGLNTMMLTWDAINGRTYNVQFKANLTDASWNSNSVQNIVATNNTASFADTADTVGTNSHRFYRIQLEAPSFGN